MLDFEKNAHPIYFGQRVMIVNTCLCFSYERVIDRVRVPDAGVFTVSEQAKDIKKFGSY